ncbi:hypothetical protein E2C01_010746 [Portunus trituberculatus]|uniref:Uncharacterized protein n=1 Tax=Portunus trituberculatus TaxID=210409 RepID=A0A5B7D9H2_PORTR|nr:hypothetical protein [Portunus trituberculatus]
MARGSFSDGNRGVLRAAANGNTGDKLLDFPHGDHLYLSIGAEFVPLGMSHRMACPWVLC